MKLIQLILNNWFLVAIVLFFLSSFWKRAKPPTDTAPKKSTGPSMPPFGGNGDTGWGRMKPRINNGQGGSMASKERSPAQGGSRQIHAAAQLPVEPARTSADKVKDGYEEQPDFWDASPLNDSYSVSQEGSKRNSLFQNKPDQNRTRKLSADRLAEGIIWAEILGPPRSKKPFRK